MRALCAALVLLFTGSTAASAADMLVGNATGLNCFPFGCSINGPSSPLDRYQQVYSSSVFPGKVKISSLSFFAEPDRFGNSETLPRIEDFRISLSTSSTAVNALQKNVFDENVGFNNKLIFDGHLIDAFDRKGRELRFDLKDPFFYDPAAGNLLLDVAAQPKTKFAFAIYFLANNRDSGGVFSRYYNIPGLSDGYFNNTGLVTSFGISAVPEASTWAMMILGFGFVGFAVRKRQQPLAHHLERRPA